MKYKICVSGAAETGHCSPDAKERTEEIGREIIRQNGVLITGATTGAPVWATTGAKEEGGFSIGLSPASSEIEHVKKYRLPTESLDIIIFTGFGYSGRNLLLTRSSDAVIITCGRIGTLNEFTIAFEDHKPIGILTGTGGVADEIEGLVGKLHRPNAKIIYDSDPKVLVKRLIDLVEEEKERAEPDKPFDFQEQPEKEMKDQ